MIVFSKTLTPRLNYIIDFIEKEIATSVFRLTSDLDDYKNSQDQKINYSSEKISPDEFWLSPHTLLFEKEISQQKIDCFQVNNNKAFFQSEGDYPFDIFAASFYLLSRYEEYLPHKKDEYGRYAHENSMAFKENFLHLPLINIWMKDFRKALHSKFPNLPAGRQGSTFPNSQFQFLPTYDIDEGFCYKHKSWWKTWGGYCRSFLTGNFWEVKERKNVLSGKEADPYDSLFLIRDFHKKYHYLDAAIFFLVAERNSRYDKNISPFKKYWQEYIRSFFEKEPAWTKIPQPNFITGLHPSWRSGKQQGLIRKEMDILQNEIGVEVHGSRQHFIRFNLPKTFRQLIDAGIFADYSMGYGSINGFRASAASSFYWYDLEKDEKTDLKLYPFCYMEANSFFEQKYSPEQALEEMLQYFNAVKSVDGLMITIWHNTFLGTHKRFAGWREVYKEFIRKIYYQLPTVNNQIDNEGMDRQYFLH